MEYQNLITKFFAGEISEKEIIHLKSWLSQDPENRRIFDNENELWQEASVLIKCKNFNTDTAWINISSRLGLVQENSKSVTILNNNNFRLLIAAATVACLLAIGGISLWVTGNKSFKDVATSTSVIKTNEGEKARIFLADSTEIIMNSESSLQYNGNYNLKDRKVKFAGEAFFDVSTNREKPFIVQLEKINVIATGTRFNIYSFGIEDRIEATLEEGAIQVTVKGKEPVNIKSGQQAIYFVNSQKLIVRDVATDTYTSWKENMLRFNDTPFEEVLRRIGRKYNVKFEITNHELLDLKFTATFIDESVEEVMEMLKSVSPINYKIYYRTSVRDRKYLKPRIVVCKRKTM